MGLDMYLTRSIYVGANYDHNQVDGALFLTKGGRKLNVNFNKVSSIRESAMYWRKANHIHKWFVDNVQGGNDDCKEYYVSKEKVQELINLCKKVIKNPEQAQKLLPTQEGFFFGGTSYDEYYFQDCKETAKVLAKLLKQDQDDHDVDYYYSSSW